MEQLTQMELLQIKELLDAEELALKKYKIYLETIKDDELYPFIQESASLHQQNILTLIDLMKKHNGKEEVGW